MKTVCVMERVDEPFMLTYTPPPFESVPLLNVRCESGIDISEFSLRLMLGVSLLPFSAAQFWNEQFAILSSAVA